jgi:hypothetical protein
MMSCATPPAALNAIQEAQSNSAKTSPPAGTDQATAESRPLAERLRLAALAIKSRFGGAGRRLNYKELLQSDKFLELQKIALELRGFDLTTLKSTGEKKAFWINVYNSLVIQGIAEQTARRHIETVWDIKDFFGDTAYIIGGLKFSLNDIENGILRANRRRPYGINRQFADNDPRLKFSIANAEFDPRIHFALNCGSYSCPPFAFYKSDDIEKQLETAKCGFITSDTQVMDGKLKISKIFDWYSGDFKPSVREFIMTCATDDLKTALQNPKNEIQFSEYNWHLNQL